MEKKSIHTRLRWPWGIFARCWGFHYAQGNDQYSTSALRCVLDKGWRRGFVKDGQTAASTTTLLYIIQHITTHSIKFVHYIKRRNYIKRIITCAQYTQKTCCKNEIKFYIFLKVKNSFSYKIKQTTQRVKFPPCVYVGVTFKLKYKVKIGKKLHPNFIWYKKECRVGNFDLSRVLLLLRVFVVFVVVVVVGVERHKEGEERR